MKNNIDAYTQYKKYMVFQHKRPDYNKAISISLKLAEKYSQKKNLVIGDFCCGTGINTKKLAKIYDGIEKAILIDINKGFLDIAKKSNIKARLIEIHNDDILQVKFKKECDIVVSIFAYHHIPDQDKIHYIEKIKECLKHGGILILTEIFFDNKNQCLDYYDNLYKGIPAKYQNEELQNFLKQTAQNDNFEFKVSKDFADKQFKTNGYKLLEEKKIWISNDSSPIGTFVQIYST